MDTTLRVAYDAALEYLRDLDRAPVAATVDLATLRERLVRAFPSAGARGDEVVRELVAAVDGGITGSSGGRFFGWVIGGALPAAVAADWLTSVWDNNAGLYATAPAAAVVEEVAGAWLKDILGLPASATFAFVTGCQLAHFTCLAAARHAVLERHGWNVEERGLSGAPRIRLVASGAPHGSAARALRFLGLGSSCEAGCDQPEALQSALDPSVPTIVLLQAGDINTGAFDTFETLIPVARRAGAWVHVDGAFGLWAAASPRHRHLVRGVGGADSWATDGHKWLNVPFDSGYAFVADAGAHSAAMSYRASYLTHSSDARDEMDWNPEWSRRARGFPTYAALRQLGRSGIADLVDRCCRHAHAIVMGIAGLPGVELLAEPIINQGMVRFLDPRGSDHDRRTDDVIAAVNGTGEAFFTGTTWRRMRAMRVSVCNWRTSDDDVRRVVECVGRVVAR